MPSAITQNISAAASGLVPTQGANIARQSQATAGTTPGQIAMQVSQVVAQKTATDASIKDHQKIPQIPKRVESVYAPQTIRGKKKKRASREDSNNKSVLLKDIDVIA